MALYGLKSKIAVNTVILLMTGMGLTAFIALNLTQKMILGSEISKAGLLVSAIEESVGRSCERTGNGAPGEVAYVLGKLMAASGFTFATLIMPESGLRIDKGTYTGREAVERYAGEALKRGKTSIKYTGAAMGLFWKQGEDLVVSSPICMDDGKAGAVTIVMPLESVYGKFRNVQRLLLIYIIINAVVLTVAGLHATAKAVVKPLQRLLKRAEEFKNSDEMVYFYEKNGNEFNRLSQALNHMLGRISQDREKLRQTVTSLEKANAGLKKAQKDIIRAEKLASVGRLSSGIAHEIGNPLGIVSGYLELLGDESISRNERDDFVRRSKDEIRRIDGIIRRLLDFSRVSPQKKTAVSIHEILLEMRDLVAVQPVMSGIELMLDLSAEKERVFADKDQLKQVFLNLFLNTVDACETVKEGRVEISTGVVSEAVASKTRLEIVFTDNGRGILSQHLENIFDPFFTTKEPGKGTGLGLSVCFMIIESLNGTIDVASRPGAGTSMTISLPLKDSARENS